MAILVTGGAGYIGSHTCLELTKAGYDVVIVDNLVNSNKEVLNRLKKINGVDYKFYENDVCDKEALRAIFEKETIEGVIHFAGLKAVGESCRIPLRYYQNNLISTITLLEVMAEFGVKNLVFSSSATVYGDPHTVPITEDFPLSATNPYGMTKLMLEDILRDICKADATMNVALLRYFNPVGAHESGLIGENPNGIPNNLVPYITQVAVGKLHHLSIFGNDYPTPDGTGVRDYIHVLDLAAGHVAAIHKLESNCGLVTYNLGTGKGYSVKEMADTFMEVNGVNVPYEFVDRRPGDIAECYADPKKAYEELGWKAERGLAEMLRDSWNWQKNNPNGFES